MAAERRSSAFQDLPEKFEMPDGNKYIVVKTNRNMNGYALFNFEHGRYCRSPTGFKTKKQKAHFFRTRTGIDKAKALQERLDFLTLSTQFNKDKPEKRLMRIKDLNYAWTKLKQQIEYYWQNKLYLRFCRKNHLEPYEIHSRKKTRNTQNILKCTILPAN